MIVGILPQPLVAWTSDFVLFPLLQLSLILFALFVTLMERLARRRAGRGSVTLRVTRSPQSMAIFYGAYAAMTALVVAICGDVEVARQHRVFWVTLDAAVIAYVCVGNGWFRNKLLGWATALTSVEAR